MGGSLRKPFWRAKLHIVGFRTPLVWEPSQTYSSTPFLSRQSEVLDLELPYLSKYLLLAAYIASRNKATLDRRIFDPSERSGRRRGALANDRQVRV